MARGARAVPAATAEGQQVSGQDESCPACGEPADHQPEGPLCQANQTIRVLRAERDELRVQQADLLALCRSLKSSAICNVCYDMLDEDDQKLAVQVANKERDRYKAALEWALTEETGMSSRYLVATAFDLGAKYYPPADLSDRLRCIGAIKSIPGLLNTLAELEERDPAWKKQGEWIRKELAATSSNSP